MDARKATIRAARKYGVDPEVLLRLIKQESGFNPHARSPAGAQGIAQFMPGTAKGYGVNLHDNRITDDLEGAAKYIAANLKRTGGNYKQALSIYNSGRPDGYKHIAETRHYVETILGGMNPKSGSPSGGGSAPAQGGGVNRAALAQFLLSGGAENPNALMQLAAARQSSGAPAESAPNASSRPSGGKGNGSLVELFYDPLGGIKHGKEIGAIGGHSDHVHVAVNHKSLAGLEKLARQHGLTITSTTGGKHVANSYHYKGMAADVSGDPKAMASFYKSVKRMYGVR